MGEAETREGVAATLCVRDESWFHHERTDDFPCSTCRSTADTLLAGPLAEHDRQVRAEALREAGEAIVSECDCDHCATSLALVLGLAGCACASLCEMGPTCPGGMAAGLSGSGCWRADREEEPTGDSWSPFTDCDAARAVAAVAWPGERADLRDQWAVRMLREAEIADATILRASRRFEAAVTRIRRSYGEESGQ